MAGFLSFLPSILGGLAGLFKGNKQKYTTAQTPQQQLAYKNILNLLMQNMGKGSAGYQPTSDALGMLYKQFLPGTKYTPSSGSYRVPGATSTYYEDKTR